MTVKGVWRFSVIVLLVLMLASTAFAAYGSKAPKATKPPKVTVLKRGQVFCPTSQLTVGNVVIPAGQCFTTFVMRTKARTFLAFGPPGPPMIPPGQVVRLSTPAGKKVRDRIFAAVPVQTTATAIPVNTITLAAVRVVDVGPRLTITTTSLPAANVTVTFQVRM